MGVIKDEGRENARSGRIFQTNRMSELTDARNSQMFYQMKLEKGKRRRWNLNRNRFVADAKAEVDAEAEAHAEAEAETKAEAEA